MAAGANGRRCMLGSIPTLVFLHSNDMLPLELYSQEAIIEDRVVQETLTLRYTEQALAFVEDSVANEDPFFLYLPHSFPHVPLLHDSAFKGQSDAGLWRCR